MRNAHCLSEPFLLVRFLCGSAKENELGCRAGTRRFNIFSSNRYRLEPAGRVPPYALLFVQVATKSKQKMPVAGSGHLAYDAGLPLISYLQVIRARAEPSQRLTLELKNLQSNGVYCGFEFSAFTLRVTGLRTSPDF